MQRISYPMAESRSSLALDAFFGWAGGAFPYNGSAPSDITISGPTSWTDAVGYKRVKKLTINAGQVLTIVKNPFFIFADEISFGDTSSCINGSGPNGSQGSGGSATYARGAMVSQSPGYASGGAGGIMLFIICNSITGANGLIKANGGDGWRNTSNAANTYGVGGQGALSNTYNNWATGELWDGSAKLSATTIAAYLNNCAVLLAKGGLNGNAAAQSAGGGSGGGSSANTDNCGGSGIGGGGGGAAGNGGLPIGSLSPINLLNLASLGCLGGGGGGACVSSSAGANNGGGGGGGGSVVVWTKLKTATPTLSANGGSGVNGGNGGAGVTHLIVL